MILSQPAIATIANECKVMAGQTFDPRTRRELDNTRIARDDIQNVITTIEAMVNLFRGGNRIITSIVRNYSKRSCFHRPTACKRSG
jgi:hypothetical protein